MKPYSNTFKHQLEQRILEIKKEQLTEACEVKHIYVALEQHIEAMNHWLKGYTFGDEAEEIHFFKHIRPHIIALFFYYKTRLSWLSKTNLKLKQQKQFYLDKQLRVERKLNRLSYIDQYYNMNNTANDVQYFTRQHKLSSLSVYTKEFINYDSRLCTSQCLAVAEVLSYKMLIDHLKTKFKKDIAISPLATKKLSWTASKQSLYELIYALKYAEAIDHGKTSVARIAAALEEIFDLKLKDQLYKRRFDQKTNKNTKPTFLKKLQLALEALTNDSFQK